MKKVSFLSTANMILLYNSFFYLIFLMAEKYGEIPINQI